MSRIARPAASRGNPVDDGDGDDAADQPVRVHSSVSEAGVIKPPGVPASAFEAGRIAGQANKRKRTVALPLDVDSIAIDTAVPPPSPAGAAAALADSCRVLLNKMPLNSSVVLPMASAKALIAAARKGGFGTRRAAQPGGTWRVWRVEPKPHKGRSAGAASPPPPSAVVSATSATPERPTFPAINGASA